MNLEISDLKEIEIGTANELCKLLTEIENSWSNAYYKINCKNEEEHDFLIKQAQELLTKFLKMSNLFNEWNEFNIQKIGWPDFETFEVKNNRNSQVFLRLGPSIKNEGSEWSDEKLRISVLRYLKHIEIIELTQKIKEKDAYKKAFKAAMSRFQSLLWDDEE